VAVERFQPGKTILYRGPHVDDSGKTGPPVICDVKPVIVVSDTPELLSFFLAADTPTLFSRPRFAGQPKPWGPGEWDLEQNTWDRWNTLHLVVPGEWRATWVMWSPTWEFLGWYVNLQEPLWRTRWGFDIRDLQLDILVAPDRSWRWKDEDDLQRSIECGLISEANAEETQRSAAQAIREIEAGTGPFADHWREWRPEPGWTVPQLPGSRQLEEVLRWSPEDAFGRV
jgi:hypothetical protein